MPAPRLIARSMLSFGTEVFLAFCTASTSVGLPDMSAPPIFAATSMFLISLANDLARRWSMTAFLCLVVAHLECPDTGAPSVTSKDPDHCRTRRASLPRTTPVDARRRVPGRRLRRSLRALADQPEEV